MTSPTCHQLEEQLPLFALGECEEPLRSAMADHVVSCPDCARSLEQFRQLFGLLDEKFQEAERLNRLFARLEKASFRPQNLPRVLHFPKSLVALAAMLLLAVGLTWLAPGGGSVEVPVIPGPLEALPMRASKGPEAAVTLWSSPYQPGQRMARAGMVFPSGRTWICVEPTNPGASPVTVTTLGGDLRLTTGCLFVAARADGVVVMVLRGEAALGAGEEQVVGHAGDLLVGQPGEPPQRIGGKQP